MTKPAANASWLLVRLDLHTPDHAELETVVPAALDDGRITHFHGGRIRTAQVLLFLDGLLHRLRQLAVTHFLLERIKRYK